MYKRQLGRKRLSKILGELKVYKKIPDSFHEFCGLVKVVSGAKIVPFIPYEYQSNIFKAFQTHHSLHITKVRQMGVSELALLIACYYALRNPTYSAIFFSYNRDATNSLAYRFRTILDSLTEYTTTTTDNLKSIKLINKASIKFAASTPSGGVGERLHHIFLDEAGPIDSEADANGGVEKLLGSTNPAQLTVGSLARTMLMSTPRGRSGYFYNKGIADNPKGYDLLSICEKMRREEIAPYQQWTDKGGWAKIVLHWRSHPIYGLNDNFVSDYAKKTGLPDDIVQQEVNLSFNSSAEAVFHPFLVESSCTGSFESEKDNLARYYIGVDTSGDGKDYFVAVVLKHDLRSDKYFVIDMYRKRNATKESHIVKVSELVEKYRPHTVGIEVTGNAGGLYLEDLQKMYLGTIFKEIKTTSKSKPLMVERLSYALERELLTLPDKEVVRNEFLSFQRFGTKMSAPPGKHDDIVMAIAFAVTISPLYQSSNIDLSQVNMIR